MKVLTSKGVAIHTEPESWGFVREDETQASIGESAGQPLSLENTLVWNAVLLRGWAGNTDGIANARYRRIPRGRRTCARTETTYTETGRPHVWSGGDSHWVRVENPKGAMQR